MVGRQGGLHTCFLVLRGGLCIPAKENGATVALTKLAFTAKKSGHQEIEQGPQLQDIILQGGVCACVCVCMCVCVCIFIKTAGLYTQHFGSIMQHRKRKLNIKVCIHAHHRRQNTATHIYKADILYRLTENAGSVYQL